MWQAQESIIKEEKSESHSALSNSLRRHGLYTAWNSLGQNTEVGSLSLLQGIFPTPGVEPRSFCIVNGFFTSWAAREAKNTGVGNLFFLQRIFPTGNRTGVSCFASRFFTNWATRETQGRNNSNSTKTLPEDLSKKQLSAWGQHYLGLTKTEKGNYRSVSDGHRFKFPKQFQQIKFNNIF